MSKPTDIRLKQVTYSQERIQYRTPIKFGGRVVNDALLFNVTADVETQDGRRGQGFGSMPMGNVWAWPTDKVDGETTLAALVAFAERGVKAADAHDSPGHPLELTHELAAAHGQIESDVEGQLSLADAMPRLAQLVAASPLEAAIHDAYGKAIGENSYNLLGAEFVNSDLSTYLTEEFAGEYLDQYTSRQPKAAMPIYHLVGALDPLFADDIAKRIDDGLPETLGEWIQGDGLTHLKIKLNGDDLDWDVDRVVAVERAASEAQSVRACDRWFYSLDFNEKCADVQYILDFLAKVGEKSAIALDRVQYIEQPTHRDLRANPENRMHEAAKIKPVVIDESLLDLESLLLAREQGYSGIALKACKGHSEALLMGAAAQKYNLFLCVQDLTCVGASFLHSASVAARVPTVAAIEGNGRQYCPVGNMGWDERFPGMFNISDGTVATSELSGAGLGF
ncbi:MAG: hypothetical protein CMJ64_22135 [Planctomycetaceae bacterium]|nr:hypothetical protein [Planctomycetaceae bacterium]